MQIDSRLLEHIPERGEDLFQVGCDHDLEGIVGKWAGGSYSTDGRSTSWVKIKNPAYSQMAGRAELFERRNTDGVRHKATLRPELALR